MHYFIAVEVSCFLIPIDKGQICVCLSCATMKNSISSFFYFILFCCLQFGYMRVHDVDYTPDVTISC